jgi:ribosomal protein S18 acetylase RimI-like enzyme
MFRPEIPLSGHLYTDMLLATLVHLVCHMWLLDALQIRKVAALPDFRYHVQKLSVDYYLTPLISDVMDQILHQKSLVLADSVQNCKTVVMAFESDLLVGTIDILHVSCCHYHLVNLIVHPNFRRKGVATRLLAAVLDAVTTGSLAAQEMRVELDVDKSNHVAKHLYEKAGFKPVPAVEFFLEGLLTHRTRMRRIIKRDREHTRPEREECHQ